MLSSKQGSEQKVAYSERRDSFPHGDLLYQESVETTSLMNGGCRQYESEATLKGDNLD